MYFDGTGDYLTTPTHASFSLGSGDLTIEGWFYNTSTAQYQFIFDGRQGGGASDTTYLYTNNGTTLKVGFGTTNDSTAATIVQNQWYHFALVRSGSGTNNVTLYLNGENVWNITDTTDLSSSTRMTVGSRYNIVNDFSGHVSDFRVVKGTAVYTSAFTPPTAPLTAITNTSLLLNGTDAAIIDKSQSNKLLTLTGDTKSSTTQTKYLTSSMYFDGAGDNILTDVMAASGDFTVETWIYFDGQIPNPANQSPTFFVWGTTTFMLYATSTTGILNMIGNGSGLISSSTAMTADTWHHVAFAREGSTGRLFLDGNLEGSTTSFSTSINARAVIGSEESAGYPLKGYMSDLRITKGLARYTANFTPPTAALQG